MWRRSILAAVRRASFSLTKCSSDKTISKVQIPLLTTLTANNPGSYGCYQNPLQFRFLSQLTTDQQPNSETESETESVESSTARIDPEEDSVVTEQIGAEDLAVDEPIDIESIENVLSLLQSRDGDDVDATSLHSRLNAMGIKPNEEFVLRVLETPVIQGDKLLSFYNWASKNSGFSVTTAPVLNALVSGVAGDPRKSTAYALWDLIKDIAEKKDDGNEVLNVEILNGLVGLFSKLGKGKAAFEVFNKFDEFGCVPDSDTYYFTLEALCRRSFFDWAASVAEKMVEGKVLPGSGDKVGDVISWLCKGKRVKIAYSVYALAREGNRLPPQSSVSFLVISLCQEDETVKLALEVLDDFEGKARERAIKPFSTVVCGLCRIKDVSSAKELLEKMISQGPPPGNAVFNYVISAYSKAGDMGEAVTLMKMMKSRGLKPDVYTYTVIIGGYANGGQMDEAYKIFSEAKKKHSKLSPVTYHTLIRGHCKLEDFDKALTLLAEMKDHGVQPNVDEYNKLIQSLCLKALDWETAEKLLGEMTENGLHLNGITRGLIRAVKELEQEEVESANHSLEA